MRGTGACAHTPGIPVALQEASLAAVGVCCALPLTFSDVWRRRYCNLQLTLPMFALGLHPSATPWAVFPRSQCLVMPGWVHGSPAVAAKCQVQPTMPCPCTPLPPLRLFVPDPDAWRETWDGTRLSADAAAEVFGADEALPLSQVG